MKTEKLLTAVLVLGLLMLPVALIHASTNPQPVYNQQGEVIGHTKAIPRPAVEIDYIIDSKEADVTGDSVVDKISLIGQKLNTDSPYVTRIRIEVENGDDLSRAVFAPDRLGGYQPTLYVGDFSGDRVADVFVETASGGSGGWSYHHIITFTGEPKEIFGMKENEGLVSGRFIDGWKAELVNGVNGKTIAIDVRARQQDYLRLGVYDEAGTVQKETKTMVTPFGKLEPIDVDNDGVLEVKGVQRISGAYRADGLADAEIVLKYNGSVWQAHSVKFIVNMN